MVEAVHSLWSDKAPVVIVYFSPPYYPHIYVKGESEKEKKLLDVISKIIENTKSKYDIQMRKFYPYISDLSYVQPKGGPGYRFTEEQYAWFWSEI